MAVSAGVRTSMQSATVLFRATRSRCSSQRQVTRIAFAKIIRIKGSFRLTEMALKDMALKDMARFPARCGALRARPYWSQHSAVRFVIGITVRSRSGLAPRHQGLCGAYRRIWHRLEAG